MDIKIEEQGDLYCVCVKIENYNPKYKRKIVVNTPQVRNQVTLRGDDIGEAVQTDYIHNMNGITQGTWFFKKKVLDKPKKVLDKPVQDVIIEEEKEVKPKPTRKKRTRSSTKKKVSTEG